METTHLGKPAPMPASPEAARLDYVPNPRPGKRYLVRFTVPEFTSLCPVTAQPDFAHLVIDYVPDETIVESKSLRSEEHTSELQSLMRISYAVFCLKKKKEN